KSLRNHIAAAMGEPGRLGQHHGGRGWVRQHPARELAAGGDPLLHLPDHGRYGSFNTRRQLVRQLAALPRPPGDDAMVFVVRVPRLPNRFRGDNCRLGHRRSRRQPWIVYGVLRTADAVTPSLTGPEALATLLGYVIVYAFIYGFGFSYIYRLLRE